MMEIKVKDELARRLKAENDLNLKNLKQLNTIIKIPKLTTEYHRSLRKKNEEERLKEYKKEAMH